MAISAMPISADTGGTTIITLKIPAVTHTVIFNIGANGSIFVDGTEYTSNSSIKRDENSEIVYTIKPDSGYIIDTVEYNGTDVKSALSGGAYTAPKLTGNATFNVTFKTGEHVHVWESDFTVDKAFCTEKGSKSRHCKECSEKTDVTEIDALGHDWGEWTVVKEATASATGLKRRTCRRAGCGASEDEEIPKKDAPDLAKDWTVEFDESTIKMGASGDYELTYTGSVLNPAVIVKHDKKLLINGTDYTLKYARNVNYTDKGAEITVTGIGQYTGKKILKFNVAKKNIADTDIGVGNTLVEKGKAANPTLTYNGVVLANKKDYTLSQSSGSVKVTGKGNYQGERTIAITELGKNEFKKRAIKVTMGKISRIYNGMEQTLNETNELMVKDIDGNTLKKGTDYLVSYSANMNAGTVKVTVTGTGTRCGTVKKSFKIQPAKNASFTVTKDKDSYTYVKTGVKPALTVKAVLQGSSTAVALKEGQDYKVTFSNNKKPGKGKFKLTFLNNYRGAKYQDDCEFTIVRDKITKDASTKVLAGNMLYKKAGKYKAKTYVIVNGSLLASGDYTLTYSDPDKITLEDGKSQACTVTVKAKEKNNAKYDDATGGTGVVTQYSVDFVKNKTDISKAKVKLILNSKTVTKMPYTGKAIEFKAGESGIPQLSLVIDSKTTLSAATIEEKFDVHYADNVEKGKATIILVPKKDSAYTGICAGNFTITNGVFGGK